MTEAGDEAYFSMVRQLARTSGDKRKKPDAILRRKTELLFKGIPLRDRSVLEIGGGNGLMSYYCATQGARPVVCLEPADAGSNPGMENEFRRLTAALSPDVEVNLVRDTFQNLDPTSFRYDLILIHNAINHLNEAACRRLPEDHDAWATYRDIFRKLAELTVSGGDLVIADAARKNAWAAMGRRSPFAPTIEWNIHAQPSTWASIAREAGWAANKVAWRSHDRLGKVGQTLLGNRIGAYLTNSNFILHMRRVGSL